MKWAYRVVVVWGPLEVTLDKLGAEGWELIQLIDTDPENLTAIFKQPQG